MESIHGNPPQRDLFSRGSSPPQQAPVSFAAHPNASSSQLDSLLQNLTSPTSEQPPSTNFANPSSASFATPSTLPQPFTGSGPGTPVMSMDAPRDSPASHHSGSMTTAERQSALLSLLNQPMSSVNVHRTGGSTGSLPQQVSTPPEPSQRSGASPTHNEAQGKILLEQLMAGPASRSIYPESQPAPPMSGPPSAPSPTYGNGPSPQQWEQSMQPQDYRSNQDMDYHTQYDPQPGFVAPPQQVSPPLPPQTQQAAAQPLPPSPPKSMFDFVSPFDALQSATGSIRKKPVPTSSVPSSGNEDSSWTAISDPKRRSVENLLENLTLGSPPQPPPATFESFGSMPPQPDYGGTDPLDLAMGNRYGPPPPLPQNLQPPPQPKPVPQRVDSPRASPPKNQAQRVSQSIPASQRRDKEGSPGPRGSVRGKKNKNQASPSSQSQNIVIDVSQSLEEIQTTRDLVKSTAIALVKQDAVFLPGTTIGATHWVAYAMTRGRVRVISRSSGDRTLLQLPPLFPQTTSVTDMAVYGNRLAGVTSDGGFVVWELPEMITDDVPGRLILCVAPSPMSDALHSVKWHPKEPDVLAVASERTVFLIDFSVLPDLTGKVLPITDLNHYAQGFNPQSPVVAFDFDTIHYGIATISDDSTLTIWNINDRVPYTNHPVRGEGVPSSLLFVDGAIVVGRKNGTIFQLLNLTTKAILSTIKFVNGDNEDREMFGHASYDTRIQTLWIANCRRDSFFGFKINFEPRDEATSGYFEQVVEFPGPKPTIHFVILTADSDPTGDEAHAACIAAKVPPGELALVAFSVHSTGVDQVLIRKEWYDTAFATVLAKLPQSAPPPQFQQQINEPKQRPFLSGPQNSNARTRTPPSEEVDADVAREEPRQEGGRKGRGKNVNFKDKDENAPEKEKRGKSANANNTDSGGETALSQILTKEIRKTEDNLHQRISRLIGKEMDKQHARLEESRAHDQAEEITRQEKILKLISQELSRNTTRVVEIAVKNEVQNSVLPALENMTRTEVKAALNERVGRGLVDFMSQSLPAEIEKMILRPDMAQHFSNMLSSALVPAIERHVKESMSKSVIPAYQQHNAALHQELLRELRAELHGVKSEMSAWQNEAFRNQESIKQLEHTVRALSEQIKFSNAGTPTSQPGSHGPSQVTHSLSQPAPQNRPNLPPVPNYHYGSAPYPPQAQAPPPPPPQMQNWYTGGIVAPQASHPLVPPPPIAQERIVPPQAMKSEQWDEIYLSTLHTQDLNKLRDLLARSDADVVMPPNGPVLVSQAVILTLIHRLAAALGETSPTDDAFKSSLWWLQRAVAILRPEDKLISDFIPRVVPNVQQSLNTTKQRLSILPGGGTYEGARAISEVQEALRRKVVA
ncbi:hypothetical protein EV714DRAFT_250474 [Schizophyllum commune]